MDPSATAQNMCTFIGFLGPSRRGGYCHFGRSNSRKMQAKTGPVVPFVIRECRYCAGRADADVESVAAPVKILSPTRKWLLLLSFHYIKKMLAPRRRRGCKQRRASAPVLRFKRAVFPTTTGSDDMAAHILGHHAESLTQIRPLRPSDYCSISAHLRRALTFFPPMAFVRKRPLS